MTQSFWRDQRGFALATVIAVAIVVTIAATAALNITFGRFSLTALHSVDHSRAAFAAEGGVQYALQRLARDVTLRDAVQGVGNGNIYTISPTYAGPAAQGEPDLRLRMGNKDVTVRLIYRPLGAVPPASNFRVEVRASATYAQ